MITCLTPFKRVAQLKEQFDPRNFRVMKTDPFSIEKQIDFNNFLILDDNSKKKTVLGDRNRDYVFFGHYNNLLSLYKSVKLAMDTPIRETDLKSRYFATRRQRKGIAEALNKIYITVDASIGVDACIKAPHLDLLNLLMERSRRSESEGGGYLVPIHTFLTGIRSMNEWKRNGVYIESLDTTISPDFGVFNPTNQSYLNLFANTLRVHPKSGSRPIRGLDIGTGTGVLSFIMASKGVTEIDATDINPWAIQCAKQNADRLALKNIQFHECDGFPQSKGDNDLYDVIVFNPPWMTESSDDASTLDQAIFDHDGKFCKTILETASTRLKDDGYLYLIYSNLSSLFNLDNKLDLSGYELVMKTTSRNRVNPQDPFYLIKSKEEIQCFVLKRK